MKNKTKNKNDYSFYCPAYQGLIKTVIKDTLDQSCGGAFLSHKPLNYKKTTISNLANKDFLIISNKGDVKIYSEA